jgi:hypothetical protein
MNQLPYSEVRTFGQSSATGFTFFFFADSSQFVVFELERKKNKENFKQNRYRVNFESSFSTGFTVS